MLTAAWKTACITLICNVILGNIVLAWAPLAAIRFNYTWNGLGMPVTVVAVQGYRIFCVPNSKKMMFTLPSVKFVLKNQC